MAEQNLIAEIPLGLSGLWGGENLSQTPIGALIEAKNVSFQGGVIRKLSGIRKANSTAISGNTPIISGTEYRPSSNVILTIIATADGKLIKNATTGSWEVTTTLKTGLTTEQHVDFTQAGEESATNDRKLFCLNGNNTPQILSGDGITTTDLATPAADWSGTNQPSFAVLHDNRMFAGGNLNDPHRLYYTSTTNHEDFTSGTLAVFPGDGGRLIQAISFSNAIICFKNPRGVYVVDTTDPSINNWRISQLNSRIGLAGPEAITRINDDIIFVTNDGEIRTIRDTDRFSSFGTDSVTDLSEMREFIRQNVSFSGSFNWALEYNPESREVIFFYTGIGSSVNNEALIINISRNPFRFSRTTRDDVKSAWLNEDDKRPRLYLGDDNGFIWIYDTDRTNKDGNGYESLLQTPFIDFSFIDKSLSTRRKLGRFLELEIDPKGDWPIEADIFWDQKLHETITFNVGPSDGVLGNFILGTSTFGGKVVINKKRRITGGGRRFSVAIRNDTANQDFSISRIFVHMGIGDQDL